MWRNSQFTPHLVETTASKLQAKMMTLSMDKDGSMWQYFWLWFVIKAPHFCSNIPQPSVEPHLIWQGVDGSTCRHLHRGSRLPLELLTNAWVLLKDPYGGPWGVYLYISTLYTLEYLVRTFPPNLTSISVFKPIETH